MINMYDKYNITNPTTHNNMSYMKGKLLSRLFYYLLFVLLGGWMWEEYHTRKWVMFGLLASFVVEYTYYSTPLYFVYDVFDYFNTDMTIFERIDLIQHSQIIIANLIR